MTPFDIDLECPPPAWAKESNSSMKVLSIKQPWAGLIVAGIKDVENRSWSTSYRGRVLIHASREPDPYAQQDPRVRPIGNLHHCTPRGAILGYAELTDVVDGEFCQLLWCNQQPGNFAWLFKDPHIFRQPVPCRGNLGLWPPDLDLVAEAVEQAMKPRAWEAWRSNLAHEAAMKQEAGAKQEPSTSDGWTGD